MRARLTASSSSSPLSETIPAGFSKIVSEQSGIINVICFGGDKRGCVFGRPSLPVGADEFVESQRVSESSGSDTVFIALASAHFREVRIECRLTKRLFPPKSLRCGVRGFAFHLETPTRVCVRVELPSKSGCRSFYKDGSSSLFSS